MNALDDLLILMKPMAEPVALAFCLAVLLWAVHRLLLARADKVGENGVFRRQLIMIVLTGICMVVVIFLLPVSDNLRTNLLALLGLLFSGVLGLSSTTLVANGMAGFMLRSVRSFHCGDFIRIGDHFGRVTERGLFHIEIQTEDRELTTLPNLYLITNPVTVVRSSGTIISATLSLGYDVGHGQVEPLLLEAAVQGGLEDPFVRIMELGNFSVTYRVSGFLSDVKQLLTARSALNAKVLDLLHGKGIEIVSPNFMNQRQLVPGGRILPAGGTAPAAAPEEEKISPEEIIFDKAEEAERMEKLRQERETLKKDLGELEKRLHDAEETLRPAIESDMAQKRSRVAALNGILNVKPR